MTPRPAVNDNAPLDDLLEEMTEDYPHHHGETPQLHAVVSAAVLVATAFRLRDEDGLMLSLKRLCEEVEQLERIQSRAA